MGIENEYFNCYNSKDSKNNNNTNNLIDCKTLIGYSIYDISPILFLIISIIGFILNLLLIKSFLIKRNNQQSRKQSSMKKLLSILPILDCANSLYWIISSIKFSNAESINENKIYCTALSIIYFSVLTFEFIFFNFILIHLRKISLNPIEGILKPGKNIKKYLSISIISTLIILGISLCMSIIGRSPMNTCFLNTEQSGYKGLIFIVPIISTFSVIFQIIYDLKCREMFINDQHVREVYKTNIVYILVFSLLHFPMFFLIILTSIDDLSFFKDKTIYPIYRYYIYFCTLLTCSIPMIIGVIRNCISFIKKKKLKDKINQRVSQSLITISENSNSNGLLNDSSTREDQFVLLEKHSMEFFMRDILLSVAHCIYTSKSFGKNIDLKDLEKENESFIKHNIGFDTFKLNDRTIGNYLNVNVIEYAPKIFAYLRNLENINIEKMAKSFLPKNNKFGISESQGKSGSFFISTDDNQYMIKTLRVDEFDLIHKTFLNEYVKYLTRNPSSLLCRIYGMYNIIMSQGDEILIIVMRNVIGDFKNNIVAKYDLKGSSTNRIAKFDMSQNDMFVMKDINFNQYEHGIMLSKKNINRVRRLTKYDSYFLSKMELMDYSLFLVKITLTKEQAIDLFGEKIKKKQDDDFSELINDNNIIPASLKINENQQILNIDLENMNFSEKIHPKKSIVDRGKIYHHTKYYKQYIFPSLFQGTAYIMAIIDYFQYFNFYKYVESGIKTKFGKKKEKQMVSCVDPLTYSVRFIKYFEKLTNIQPLLKDGQKIDISNINTRNGTNDDDINDINEIKEVQENEDEDENEENKDILFIKNSEENIPDLNIDNNDE